MMNIKLYHNYSECEKLIKQIEQLASIDGDLKGDTSIITPTIELSGIDTMINRINYCYIPEFKRYYYVTDIVVIGTNLVQLILDVDVLMSFANEILANEAVIERQEFDYNMELRDTNIPTYNQTNIQYINFPSSFNTFSMVIPILGN